MMLIEQFFINILLQLFTVEQLNTFLGDPRTVAIIVGSLVSISGAWLGTFLLLRKLSLTSDAISHTVLLGIVLAFLLMVTLGMEPDLSSPWLIVGAALAGVATVILTEIIFNSGLVKADASLGLAFPFLFAIAIILISNAADDVHLDADAVMVGEIGVAWANTNSYCLENCDSVTITPDDPRAEVGRECTNCAAENLSPRSPDAIFEEFCANCGTYTAAQAWRERYIDESPVLVFWPKAITVMALITLANLLFIAVLYKELKLASFDAALAAALGFRPVLLTYLLMILVSVTAVGAFDAVGSILVVAFFIIPAATAYLLTDSLAGMLVLSPIIGILAAITGYDLAGGVFLGVVDMNAIMRVFYGYFGRNTFIEWNTSISASMVIMAFVFFMVTWIFSPRYGLVSGFMRRRRQREQFATQILLGHIHNHQGTPNATNELQAATLHEHVNWTEQKTQQVLHHVQARQFVTTKSGLVQLTEKGEREMTQFIEQNLATG